jgi:hypothetical protein
MKRASVLLIICPVFFSGISCSIMPYIQPYTQTTPQNISGYSSAIPAPVEMPVWVNSPYSKYDERLFIARTGFASSPAEAEKSALSNMTAYFGISISDSQRISTVYEEAVRNGAAAQWSDTTTVQRTIETFSSLDALIGAEIRDTWFDGRGVYYALALMDRAKTAVIYNDMIAANKAMIDSLVAISPAEKNTIESFIRYQFAAVVADINVSYGNVLKVLGLTPAAELVRGDVYRLEAVSITRAIPVRVTVQREANIDAAGRIENAFTKALTGYGFRTGGPGSPYTLQVNLSVTEAQLSGQQIKFARYEISAVFLDSRTGIGLHSFSINGREGHSNFPEAVNRVLAIAEQRINEEYLDSLSEAFSRLLPRK